MSDEKPADTLGMYLRALKLPSVLEHHSEIAETAEKEGWTFERYLHSLFEIEMSDRKVRRIERLRQQSNLPVDKTLATLDRARVPAKIWRQLSTLCEGHFAVRSENVLAFGHPGRGKTHVLCAVGHELVQRGIPVLFVPAYSLVQRLLRAKRDLSLEAELRRLDRFDVVLVDDIGYVQQDRDEMEVLFTFLAERYERKSVLITSNLVFSQWDRIFRDPMTTAAAIDRLVHHATILEFTGPSIRNEEAEKKNGRRKTSTQTRDEAEVDA